MAEVVRNYASHLVEIPPFGVAFVSCSCMQLYYAITLHSQQKTKPAAYSKFKKKSDEEKLKSSKKILVGARTAGALAYSLPFVLSSAVLCYQFYSNFYDQSQAITLQNVSKSVCNLSAKDKSFLLPTFMIFAHFSKRILECCFVHKYSAKKAGIKLVMGISRGYAIISGISMYFQTIAPRKYNEQRVKIGVSLWALGLIGNAYHHWILANLRKDGEDETLKNETENKKKYKIPKGGLFGLVWCPHYLFELLGWYGIAVTANTVNYWLTAAVYTGYLSGRAISTQEWYLKTFEGDEALQGNQRKAIIPFLY